MRQTHAAAYFSCQTNALDYHPGKNDEYFQQDLRKNILASIILVFLCDSKMTHVKTSTRYMGNQTSSVGNLNLNPMESETVNFIDLEYNKK